MSLVEFYSTVKDIIRYATRPRKRSVGGANRTQRADDRRICLVSGPRGGPVPGVTLIRRLLLNAAGRGSRALRYR